jgi:hypothetical protein
MRAGVFVGTEIEDYLRTLQTLGLAQLYPWSIRGFSPSEVDGLRPTSDAHPWRDHVAFRSKPRTSGPRWEIVPLRFDNWYNSGFPFGMNDGAVWKGRGATVAVQAGIATRWGPVSLAAAPVVFWAENRAFQLGANGQADNLQFADRFYWASVDRPQRFGDRAYARFDPGQSTLRVDLLGVAAGLSTADQWWGPMSEYPYVLGNNAGGFPHVFVGSSRPWNLFIGRLHTRLMYGRLDQTGYTNIPSDSVTRLAASAIAVFTPRGVPGLELGAARFFHVVWLEDGLGWRELRKPFEGILKATLPRGPAADPGTSTDNQLASLFLRWVLPRVGFEAYGEYGREDHNWDSRDAIMEPDHSAAFGVGLRKAWERGNNRIIAVRAEAFDYHLPVLAVYRTHLGTYHHNYLRQGHTHRGQLLGTGIGVGGGSGGVLAFETYSPTGRFRVVASRLVLQDPVAPTPPAELRTRNVLDVQHVLGVERSLYLGTVTVTGAVTGVYEMNRHLRRDTGNLAVSLGGVWWLR